MAFLQTYLMLLAYLLSLCYSLGRLSAATVPTLWFIFSDFPFSVLHTLQQAASNYSLPYIKA